MSIEFSSILDECRRNIGIAPRRYGVLNYVNYLRTPPPLWAINDDLRQFFKRQKFLLERGQVVWGHTVQANGLLFSPGSRNLPGEVVYCNDPSRLATPIDLEHIALQLYQLKGIQAPDPEQQKIGDYLADERIRVFGLLVPKSISPSLPCAISTVYFNRKHLPTGRLSDLFFPLLISPDHPRIAMVLPSRYWSQRLKQNWT